MGRWYRHPKKLNLKYLLRNSGCEFIFAASQTSMDEPLELQASFSSVFAPERLRRDVDSSPSLKRILIVAEDGEGPALSARLHDGWRAVVVIPLDAQRKRQTSAVFFTQQLRYKISHRYWYCNSLFISTETRTSIRRLSEAD
jgi:hypothetical protein